jgi:hypothetical protein
MPKLVTQCPACRDRLVVTRLSCPACGLNLDGQFELPPLLGLDAEDLAFVVDFVRASGSLKEMAKREGRSYPTIRARLDELIARLDALAATDSLTQRQILDAVAQGKMTAAQGAAKLKELKR